jgi:hypothetical protein
MFERKTTQLFIYCKFIIEYIVNIIVILFHILTTTKNWNEYFSDFCSIIITCPQNEKNNRK